MTVRLSIDDLTTGMRGRLFMLGRCAEGDRQAGTSWLIRVS